MKADGNLLALDEAGKATTELPHIPKVGPMQKSSLVYSDMLTSTFDNSQIPFSQHFDAY